MEKKEDTFATTCIQDKTDSSMGRLMAFNSCVNAGISFCLELISKLCHTLMGIK